jgi:hypothetical protein
MAFGGYSQNSRDPKRQREATGIKGRSSVKRVFTTDMCAHVWAQQSQEDGRSANGNLFFRGATIYSYGEHFPIARFTDAHVGAERVVLFNSGTYSTTTSQHQSTVRSALDGLAVKLLRVPVVAGYGEQFAHGENVAALMRDLEQHAEAMANPRKRAAIYGADTVETRTESLSDYALRVTEYCNVFALPVPALNLADKREAIRKAFEAYNDPKAVAKRERASVKREGKRAIANAELLSRAYAYIEGIGPRLDYDARKLLKRVNWDVTLRYNQAEANDPTYRYHTPGPSVTPEQWRNGLGNINALGYGRGLTLLRRKGDTLETSRGAEVPFVHAVRAFHKAQQCRRFGVDWHRNGDRCPVGVFQVDAIDTTGNLKAGCHTLNWDEMLRLAVREIPQQVRPTFPVPALIAS